MKKSRAKGTTRRRADAQVKEFEGSDLGDDIARSGAGRMLRRSRPIEAFARRAVSRRARTRQSKGKKASDSAALIRKDRDDWG